METYKIVSYDIRCTLYSLSASPLRVFFVRFLFPSIRESVLLQFRFSQKNTCFLCVYWENHYFYNVKALHYDLIY